MQGRVGIAVDKIFDLWLLCAKTQERRTMN